MAGVNKVILVGNLGADPEVRYMQDETPVASLRIATSESWTDKQGNRQEKTEWHSVSVWGKQAELCKMANAAPLQLADPLWNTPPEVQQALGGATVRDGVRDGRACVPRVGHQAGRWALLCGREAGLRRSLHLPQH